MPLSTLCKLEFSETAHFTHIYSHAVCDWMVVFTTTRHQQVCHFIFTSCPTWRHFMLKYIYTSMTVSVMCDIIFVTSKICEGPDRFLSRLSAAQMLHLFASSFQRQSFKQSCYFVGKYYWYLTHNHSFKPFPLKTLNNYTCHYCLLELTHGRLYWSIISTGAHWNYYPTESL